MKHLDIRVEGRVQGVFFRAETQRMARSLGVMGFVRNEPDGSVYIEAEADEETLARFVRWLHRGPEAARVESVTPESGAVQSFPDFEVRL